MVVRNIAGKTEIIPEMKGRPIDAIQTEAPIAIPAAAPLDIKTVLLTEFFPLGAGGPVFTAENPNAIEAKVVRIAMNIGSNCSEADSTSAAARPAKIAQRTIDSTDTPTKSEFPLSTLPNQEGEFLQTTRKRRFKSMPIGTIDIAAENDSWDPTSLQIPMLAGTIVVGRVITPPSAPPPLSTKTVEMIATNPAKRAGTMML